MKHLILACVLLLSVSGVFGQSADTILSSVSVIGEAEIIVSPDQVVFTLEIITTGNAVAAAKRANDAGTVKTLETAKTFQIAPQDVQTDSLTISPKYASAKDPRGEHRLIGYDVTKRILITLRDLGQIDAFLSKVIDAGVNRVVGISIENSQVQKYEEQVRAMAVTNARAKAQNYAKQLGQTVGRAYSIREEGADQVSFSGGDGSGSGNGADSGTGSDSFDLKADPFGKQITFALGQIKIEETIYVTFQLNR